jgi:transmembrane sensor
MEEKRLWELIAKKTAGEINEQELHELNALLEKFPEALYTLETVNHYWNARHDQTAINEREEALAKHMMRFKQEKPIRKKGTIIWRMAGLAAAAAVLLFMAGQYMNWGDKKREGLMPVTKTLAASKGTKNHFTLPDGSKVWLNAGSTLTWEEDFGKKKMREVTLVGEGFFEVRHDDKHPFVIHTNRMDIRDVGTSFNVKAYPSDKTTEATLIEGAIEVLLKNGKGSTVLSKPNEKIIVSNHTPATIAKVVPATADSLIEETAWMKDMLVFKNETFAELAIKMERWYDVTIVFENEQARRHRFTGVFANETIEQALDELKLVYSFRYTEKKGAIVIH